MTYYSGDFRGGGGFYGRSQGDPGFFSFLGGLAKSALGFVPGVGPIASRVVSGVEKVGGMKMIKGAVGIAKRHPVLTAAGGAGMVGAMAGAEAGRMRRTARRVGGGMRAHRRMRVTNPKALRRAIRRTQGFAKLAMRTIHLVHPKKKARFGGFRKRTRKAA